MSDVRLIDANALYKKINESIKQALEWENEAIEKKDIHEVKYAIDTKRSLLSMLSRVLEEPTIDAQSVRYGKWIETVVRGTPSICCSMCGSESPVCYPLNFCPDCGAEMCGGDRNETD
jgi:rRNA maturation endonuclease Nob1